MRHSAGVGYTRDYAAAASAAEPGAEVIFGFLFPEGCQLPVGMRGSNGKFAACRPAHHDVLPLFHGQLMSFRKTRLRYSAAIVVCDSSLLHHPVITRERPVSCAPAQWRRAANPAIPAAER